MTTVEKLKNVKQHTVYKNTEGKRVPGVTTFLGVLNKPALVKWANNLGLQGIDSTKYVDKLASIGTLSHYRVECEWRGAEPDLSAYSPEEIDMSDNSLLSYYAWAETHNVEPVLVEEPLVSEAHQFGGTIDCLAYIDGALSLLDIKTSKGIFPEHVHQLAAYYHLLVEHGYEPTNVRILRIGRTPDEGFEDRVFDISALDPHWQIFLACQRIYQLQKVVRGSM